MNKKDAFSVLIDKNLYNGDYNYIKIQLKNVFVEIGLNLGWKLKYANNNNVVFTTPASLRSLGETVTVDFSTHLVTVTSSSNQKSVLTSWGKNDENCRNYTREILPNVTTFLNSQEKSRQILNKNHLESLKNISLLSVNPEVLNIITNNQSKFEKSLIPNLLKAYSYYEEQIRTQNVIFNNLQHIDCHSLKARSVDYSVESIKVFSTIIKVFEITILEMLKSYLDNDLITFYLIYNKFEEMGLFLSKGEKLIIKGLHDINNNLDNLITNIDFLVDRVSEIGLSMNEINTNINFANLLTTINTYQLYKIKSK